MDGKKKIKLGTQKGKRVKSFCAGQELEKIMQILRKMMRKMFTRLGVIWYRDKRSFLFFDKRTKKKIKIFYFEKLDASYCNMMLDSMCDFLRELRHFKKFIWCGKTYYLLKELSKESVVICADDMLEMVVAVPREVYKKEDTEKKHVLVRFEDLCIAYIQKQGVIS